MKQRVAGGHAPHWLAAAIQGVGDFDGLTGRQQQWERAALLLGAADAMAQTLGRSVLVAVAEEYQRPMDSTRAALGEADFAAAWAAGRAMPLEEAIRYALKEANNWVVAHP